MYRHQAALQILMKNFIYSKFSKILNTFLCMISELEITKILVRIENREDPDQTASSEAV